MCIARWLQEAEEEEESGDEEEDDGGEPERENDRAGDEKVRARRMDSDDLVCFDDNSFVPEDAG